MGNFLQLIKKDGRGQESDFFLDFESTFPRHHIQNHKHHSLEDAQPTPEEQEVFGKVKVLLDQSVTVLANLTAYTGAGDEIRVVCNKIFHKRFLIAFTFRQFQIQATRRHSRQHGQPSRKGCCC